ncbi:TrmH family RNA methyltransferase [Simkania sp.]|uniref:TrmH family RNA methyltransferase n=1 Tax=Simkania sp. TaxID=34094 RepID=UPI003B523B5F
MQLEDLLTKHSPEKIVEILSFFLTEERKIRIDQVLLRRVKGVQVALESPADIHNALAVTRTGEALGVYQFHLIDAQLVKGQGKATMRGSSRWIHLQRHETLEAFRLKMLGFTIAGASLDGELTLEELPQDRPLCLLFGNERKGLTPKAKEMCDLLYRIPMVGMVESFNLSVSASLSLYQMMRGKTDGDLSQEEQLEEKARYYVRSIGIKVAHDILQRSRE